LIVSIGFGLLVSQNCKSNNNFKYNLHEGYYVRLCGLVVRVPGYRSRGPGSILVLPDFLRSSGSGTGSTQPREYNLENQEYGRRDSSRWPRDTLYPQKLALTSPTSCSCSVGIVHSWTQAIEFFYEGYYRRSYRHKVMDSVEITITRTIIFWLQFSYCTKKHLFWFHDTTLFSQKLRETVLAVSSWWSLSFQCRVNGPCFTPWNNQYTQHFQCNLETTEVAECRN
jgi:hypothetical protein